MSNKKSVLVFCLEPRSFFDWLEGWCHLTLGQFALPRFRKSSDGVEGLRKRELLHRSIQFSRCCPCFGQKKVGLSICPIFNHCLRFCIGWCARREEIYYPSHVSLSIQNLDNSKKNRWPSLLLPPLRCGLYNILQTNPTDKREQPRFKKKLINF